MVLSIQPVSVSNVYEGNTTVNQKNTVSFKSAKDIVTLSKGAKKALSNKTIRNTFMGAFAFAILEFFGLEQLMNTPSEAEQAVRENVFKGSYTDILKEMEKSPEKKKKFETIKREREIETKSIISDAVDEILANNLKYKNIDINKSEQIKDKMYEIANLRGYNFRMDENTIDYAIAILKKDFKTRSF